MKKEHLDFLKNLQEQLTTQPTDGNCDPRYWGILETKRDYGYEEDAADGWVIYDGEALSEIGNANDSASVIRELTEEYELPEEAFQTGSGSYLSYPDDIVYAANEALQKRDNRNSSYAPLQVVYYRDVNFLARDAIFLTKKACKEHIAKFGYNYSNPRTYVMTASRCPEYEMLLDVIKDTLWDEIIPDEEK